MNYISSFRIYNEGLFGLGKPSELQIQQAIGFLFIKPPKDDEFFYKDFPSVGDMKSFLKDSKVKDTTLKGLLKILKNKKLDQYEKTLTKKILKYIKKLNRLGKSDPGTIDVVELGSFKKSFDNNKSLIDKIDLSLS